MAEIVKIKVGYAYPSSPLADAHNGGEGFYYVNDDGAILIFHNIVWATNTAAALFHDYHVSGRMVQITNY